MGYNFPKMNIDRFGYDVVVIELIRNAVEVFSKILNPASVILVGSASRAELSYRWYDNKLEFFSDLEFIIISDASEKQVCDVQRAIRKLEAPFQLNPLFHIDYSILSSATFRRNAAFAHIRTLEMIENGKIVYGTNLLMDLPSLSIDHLEPGRLRELILIRLFNMLLYTPYDIVKRNYDGHTELLYKYILARNLLEIPTILLPFLGVCRTSYYARLHWLKENSKVLLANGIGLDFIESQEKALTGKMDLCFSDSIPSILEETLTYYRKLICWLVKHQFDNPEDFDLFRLIKENGLKMLEGRHGIWRFYKIYELFLGMRFLNGCNLKGLIDWFSISKRDYAVLFLILMHQSLLEHLREEEGLANSYLDSALDVLQEISLYRFSLRDDAEFSIKWNIIRKQFIKAILPIMRWQGRIDEYMRVLSFKYV